MSRLANGDLNAVMMQQSMSPSISSRSIRNVVPISKHKVFRNNRYTCVYILVHHIFYF
jgi:hypothetical protein